MKNILTLAILSTTITLLTAGPLAAQEIDWQQVKETWKSLTPEEQEAYRQRMPAAKEARADPRGLVATDLCTLPPHGFVVLPFQDSGSTVGFANDYDIAGIGGVCDTGFDSNGSDVAYGMIPDVTCDVRASVTGDFDEVLYVVTDCGDLAGSCIGSDDSGKPEEVSFTADAGTAYFVIVDGWNGQSGNYTLDITETTATGCTMWPVELQTFTID